MKRIVLAMAKVAVFAFFAVAACSSKSDDDDDPDTSTNQGGSGGAEDCSNCYVCAKYTLACMKECPPGDQREVVCKHSVPILETVNKCICDPARGQCGDLCETTCALTATGGAGSVKPDTDQCIPCQTAAIKNICATEWNACSTDTECK